MSKKDEFKMFLRNKPELVTYIKNKDTSLQELYELYDIYGDDESIWNKYSSNNSNKITDIVKNIDIDKIEHHVNNAQKALNLMEDFTTNKNPIDLIKGPLSERPLNKFFED